MAQAERHRSSVKGGARGNRFFTHLAHVQFRCICKPPLENFWKRSPYVVHPEETPGGVGAGLKGQQAQVIVEQKNPCNQVRPCFCQESTCTPFFPKQCTHATV